MAPLGVLVPLLVLTAPESLPLWNSRSLSLKVLSSARLFPSSKPLRRVPFLINPYLTLFFDSFTKISTYLHAYVEKELVFSVREAGEIEILVITAQP